jgi:hypothetical protein
MSARFILGWVHTTFHFATSPTFDANLVEVRLLDHPTRGHELGAAAERRGQLVDVGDHFLARLAYFLEFMGDGICCYERSGWCGVVK